MNPLNQLLEPFRGIDIAATYNEFSPFIDFVIYLVIFTGLTRFVFSKRFPGRGGKAISIGIALVLSTGASVFSATTGFKLANFGPLAAGILVILVGILTYGLLRHLAGNSFNAGIASFIVTYFLVRSVTPEFYAWAEQNQFAAWLDAVLLLAIPVLLVILFLRVKTLFTGQKGLSPDPQIKDSVAGKQTQQKVSDLESRKSLEKQSHKAEKNAAKKEKVVARDLNHIISILKAGSLTQKTRAMVSKTLDDLRRQDNELAKLLNQLRLISQKLGNWQITGFQKLSATYQKLNPDDQRRLKAAIQAEQQTIMKNRTIDNIEKRINQFHQQFLKQLNLAINELNHDNSRGAVYFLLQAQETEKESRSLLKRLKRMQKDILKLTRAETELVKKLAA
jgi:hypothetical protein